MKKILLSVLVLSAILVSCTKETTRQVDQAFSAVYDLLPSGWTISSDKKVATTSLQVPEIDDYVLQNGAVLVFMSFDNTKSYEAIPQVFNGDSYNAIHLDGYVDIDVRKVNEGDVLAPTATYQAKVVIIDATALAVNKNVNLKDFSAVQKAFNVK